MAIGYKYYFSERAKHAPHLNQLSEMNSGITDALKNDYCSD